MIRHRIVVDRKVTIWAKTNDELKEEVESLNEKLAELKRKN